MRTLLLTPWCFPHKILRWEDAVTMMFKDKAEVLVSYEETVSSPSLTIRVPAVLRLRRAVGGMKRGVKFSRVNVYTRDGFCCQYCGRKFTMKALSYDHVVPRKSGGKTEWDNIVTACKQCNNLKADRTCEESGMWPLNEPRRPKSLAITGPVTSLADAPAEWQGFCAGIIDLG